MLTKERTTDEKYLAKDQLRVAMILNKNQGVKIDLIIFSGELNSY